MARYTDADYDRERGYRGRENSRRSGYDPGYYGRNRNAGSYSQDHDYNYGPGGWENYSYESDYDRNRDWDRNRWSSQENRRYDRDNGNNYGRFDRGYGSHDQDYGRTYGRYDRNYDHNWDYDERSRGYGDRTYGRSGNWDTGQGYGRSNQDQWDQDRQRWQQDRDYDRGWNRGYGRDQHRGQDRDWSREREHDRGLWDRAGDEVRSWFGDEGAERRRERDDREQPGRWRNEGRRTGHAERRRDFEPHDAW